MVARRHQEVARAFRAGCRQDRRLELRKALIDHPLPDRGDHLRTQHDVLVHLLPAQIDVAVFQPDLVGVFLVAGHLHRQHVGRGLHIQDSDLELDLAGRQARVHRAGLAQHHVAGHGDHALRPQRFGLGEGRAAGRKDALGQAVMVAQINEQQSAMVALGVDPARKAGRLAGVGGGKRAAGMGAVGVHVHRSRIEAGETSPGHRAKSRFRSDLQPSEGYTALLPQNRRCV